MSCMALSSRILSILFVVILFQEKLKAQFTLDSKPSNVVYVEAGKTLLLDVTFTYTGLLTLTLVWSFNGKALVQKIGNAKPVSLLPGRADIEGQGSLVVKNTSLQDKGTYHFAWGGSAVGNADFTVIILVRPTATLNVSSPSTVPQNSDVYYSCEGKNGVTTSTVSWYKGNTLVVKGKILSFRNIKRDQAGSYTCKLQSGTLTDETVLEVIVQFKPSSTTLKIIPDIAIITKSVKITCKAEGLPEPTYVIYHNCAKLTDKGEITINPVKYSHAGEYRCNATNKLGKDSANYFLKVKATPITKTSSTTTPTVSTSRTTSNASEKSNCECTGCVWYITLGTLFGGIIIGMIFHYGITSLRRRFKRKKDESKPAHNYDTPETHPEGIADNSTYQELELKNREPENSYQALRVNTRRRIDNETKIEDEAGYQELDKVREKDNNYQSLNHV